MAEWQTQQTQNLPTINRVGSSPTSPTKKDEVTPISWTDVTIYGGTFMLITRETKLEIVKKHLEDGVTLKELSHFEATFLF